MTIRPLVPIGVALLLALVTASRAAAHDDAPKPVADVVLTPNGNVLMVSAHLPVVALMDANLPRKDDRTLDTAVLTEPLRLIGRDFATTLELAQGGEPLPFPLVSAVLTDDRSAVDLTLTYVIQSGPAPLSARLHRFRSLPDPVPMRAQFVVSPTERREFIVAGGPEVVVFDPTGAQTVRQFVGRGARAVLDGWVFTLFLLALAFPARSVARAQRLLFTFLAAETLGAIGGRFGVVPVALAPLALAVAASIVVIASLVGVVNASDRWMAPLAGTFGLLTGLVIGIEFNAALPHAGGHATVALGALLVTILLSQAWLLFLFSVVRDIVLRWGVPARAAAIGVLVYSCHGALHIADEQVTAFAATTSWNPDRLFIALVLGWMLLAIAAGTRDWRSRMAFS